MISREPSKTRVFCIVPLEIHENIYEEHLVKHVIFEQYYYETCVFYVIFASIYPKIT